MIFVLHSSHAVGALNVTRADIARFLRAAKQHLSRLRTSSTAADTVVSTAARSCRWDHGIWAGTTPTGTGAFTDAQHSAIAFS